jgi:hypothetical protein
MRFYASLVLTAALFGCASPSSNFEVEQKQRAEQIAAIDTSKGVGPREAKLIADYYAYKYVLGCGVVGEAVDRGRYYSVQPYIGIGAVPHADQILVKKSSGKVSWAEGPTFTNVRALLGGAP